MTHKYQQALMQALIESHKDGAPVTVFSPFTDNQKELVDVPVIDIDQERWRFRIRRIGDDIGKWFYIGHVLGVRFADGRTLRSPDGEAYWERIKEKRAKKATWQQELTNESAAPDAAHAPYGLSFKIDNEGTRIPGPPGSNRDVEMFIIRGQDSKPTAIYVKNSNAAHRVSGLVGDSYWDLAYSWLISEFVWIDWIRKNSMGNLVPQRVVTQVFRWAQATQPDAVNLFIAKTGADKICFKPSVDHINQEEIDLLLRAKLCVPATSAPLEIMLYGAPFNDTRAFLKQRGIKVTTKEDALKKLKAIAFDEPSEVENFLRTAPGFVGRCCFVPPCQMTWETWQDFRTWHRLMIIGFNAIFGMVD